MTTFLAVGLFMVALLSSIGILAIIINDVLLRGDDYE